jgi:hypothetical protein
VPSDATPVGTVATVVLRRTLGATLPVAASGKMFTWPKPLPPFGVVTYMDVASTAMPWGSKSCTLSVT